jgi:hypothetical protein
LKVTDLLKNPRFFFGLNAQIVVFAALTFLMPIMSVNLKEDGFGEVFIGCCFALPTFFYVVASTFVYALCQRWSKRTVIFIGFLLIASALSMIGPSHFVPVDKEGIFIILGLSTLGMAGGFVVIPIMPELLESIEEDESINVDEDELN